MNVHKSELVEALVDNQLKGYRRWATQRHISRCPVCALTYRRHVKVRQMLQANLITREMEDSAEFFWSKVKRDIESQSGERRAAHARVPDLPWRAWLGRPAWVSSMAVAALVILGGIGWLMQNQTSTQPMPHARVTPPTPERIVTPAPSPTPPPVVAQAPSKPRFAEVENINTVLPHTVATSFESEDEGVTVIWVSGLPWTRDLTELQTLLANPGSLST